MAQERARSEGPQEPRAPRGAGSKDWRPSLPQGEGPHKDKEQEWNEGSWEQEADIRDSRGVHTELRSISERKRRNGEAL